MVRLRRAMHIMPFHSTTTIVQYFSEGNVNTT